MKQEKQQSQALLKQLASADSITDHNCSDRFYEKINGWILDLNESCMKIDQQNPSGRTFHSKKTLPEEVEFGKTLIKLLTCLEFVSKHKNTDFSENQIHFAHSNIEEIITQLKRSIRIRERMNLIEQKINKIQKKQKSRGESLPSKENVSLKREVQKIKGQQGRNISIQPEKTDRQQYYENSYRLYQTQANYQFYPYQCIPYQDNDNPGHSMPQFNMFYNINNALSFSQNEASFHPNSYFYPQQNIWVRYANSNNPTLSNSYHNLYFPLYQTLPQPSYGDAYHFQDNQSHQHQQNNQ